MSYTNQQDYAKFLAKKCQDEGNSEGCTGCKKNEDCGCCPAGLVAIYDENGKHQGCVTPNDAQELENALKRLCDPGYIALYNNSTTPPTFLGCVTESEFPAVNAAVNGDGQPIEVTDISIIPDDTVVAVDESVQFYARFTPLNTTNQNVTWTSSNAAVATVSSNGIVTGIGAGSATIKATSDEDTTIFAQRVITVS